MKLNNQNNTDRKQKIDQAYFELSCKVVESCFYPLSGKLCDKQKQIQANENFLGSPILKHCCNCSYNLEYEKIKKLIKRKIKQDKALLNKQYGKQFYPRHKRLI